MPSSFLDTLYEKTPENRVSPGKQRIADTLKQIFPDASPELNALGTVLTRAYFERGHTGIPESILRDYLGYDPSRFKTLLTTGERMGMIASVHGRVGLKDAFLFEHAIVEEIKTRRGGGRTLTPPPDRHLTDTQKSIFELVKWNNVVFLTGGPGTGKTYTASALLHSPQLQKLSYRIVAPTGKAAKRISSLSGMNATTIQKALGRTHRYVNADIFVIDESSMIDVPLMFSFLRHTPGTSAFLFVGDRDQLPPVGPGRPFADLIGKAPTLKLTEVHRQAQGNPIIQAAMDIKIGRVPLPDENGDHFNLIEVTTVSDAYGYLRKVAQRRPMILTAGNKGALGTKRLNLLLQSLLNPTGRYIGKGFLGLPLRDGDPALWVKNDYTIGLMNGETGEIRWEDGVVFKTPSDDYQIPENMLGMLMPAYAMTVHRSQGSEWDEVVTILSPEHRRLLSRELLYTAMTRSKEKHTLIYFKDALELARRVPGGFRYTFIPTLW